jgi:hypothetical protein
MPTNSEKNENSIKYTADLDKDEKTVVCFRKIDYFMIFLNFLPIYWFSKTLPCKSKIHLTVYWIIFISFNILLYTGFAQDDGPIVGVVIIIEIWLYLGMISIYEYYVGFEAKESYEKKGKIKAHRQDFELRRQWQNGNRYYLVTALDLRDEFDHEGDFKWNTLSKVYDSNLELCKTRKTWPKSCLIGNSVPDTPRIIEKTRDAIEWKSNDNGLELLYSMSARFGGWNAIQNSLLDPPIILIPLVACCLLLVGYGVITQISISAIVKNDLFGVMVRIGIGLAFGVVILWTGSCLMETPIGVNVRMPDLSRYISLDKLYKKDEEKKSMDFVIDVFDIKSLKTYFVCAFSLRSTMMMFQQMDDFILWVVTIFTILLSFVGLGLTWLEIDQREEFGYGFFTVIMVLSVFGLLIMFALVLTQGYKYNQVPKKIKENLKKLKKLYYLMKNINDNHEIQKAPLKIQFLFKCMDERNHSDVNFEALIAEIKKMKHELHLEIKNNSYKFLGVMDCTWENIVALLIPLSGILWAAIVAFYQNVVRLMENSYLQ